MKKALFIVVMALFSILAQACAEEAAGFGSVQVSWTITGSQCGTAGIVLVRVDLVQEGTPIVSESAPCSGGSKILLEDVPEGVYDVIVTGLDKDSRKIYQGSMEGLRVRAGAEPVQTGSIPVVVIKGELKLMWILPTAKPCSGNDISKVEATLWRGVDVVRTVEFYCDPGAVALSKPEQAILDQANVAFEDGWMVFRELVPGELRVNLFGLSDDGLRTAFGEDTVEVPIGNDVELEVLLSKCQDPCQ